MTKNLKIAVPLTNPCYKDIPLPEKLANIRDYILGLEGSRFSAQDLLVFCEDLKAYEQLFYADIDKAKFDRYSDAKIMADDFFLGYLCEYISENDNKIKIDETSGLITINGISPEKMFIKAKEKYIQSDKYRENRSDIDLEI